MGAATAGAATCDCGVASATISGFGLPGEYFLYLGRLSEEKDVGTLLTAWHGVRWPLLIVGDGPDRQRLESVADRHGLDGRARFAGRVDEQELADLYARCLAVYYAPVDEDFGMVPYEAFLAEKPVVTTTDSGGPLEVVADRRTGLVCEPLGVALAEACSWLRNHVDDAKAWGKAGKEIARSVSWDETIARLLS